MAEHRHRQTLTGEVTSTKMERTVIVKVTRKVKHPMYKKFIKRYKKYLAHTASVVPKNGDIVLFPSSLFHRTIPFHLNEERISIAFDLTPT